MTIDLAPSSLRLAQLVAAVPDDALGRPTPCAAFTVGDLVAHVGEFAEAFTVAAGAAATSPQPAIGVDADWRTATADQLASMTAAWREPAAWERPTTVGGVELPGDVCGLVGLGELVVHGWDLSRAIGHPFRVADESVALLVPLIGGLASPLDAPSPEHGGGPFGPARPVGDDAGLLDRLVALSGRDPAWRAPA